MPKKFTEEEYAKILPKKRVGAGVLFFNTKGELLIVKPDYRKEWLVPGGVTDENESPLHSAVREVKEEIGLDVTELKLVGVYYGPKNGIFTDSLKFIFSGGVLTEDQIARIKLQKEELEEYRFVSIENALSVLSISLQKSIPACLKAIKNKTVAYIEI
ncbi:MAG: NUDIX hydrolase [Patescibacteria group bacterium]